MIILIDSREKENSHILNYMAVNKISVKRKQALKFGDYSFIDHNTDYRNLITIERKNSLDELALNLTSGKKDNPINRRERFKNEFKRAKEAGAKMVLLIENATQENILNHNYRSKLHPNAFIGSLNSWYNKGYIDNIFFCQDKNDAGWAMLKIFHNFLKELTK
jgi:hypothetical protein